MDGGWRFVECQEGYSFFFPPPNEGRKCSRISVSLIFQATRQLHTYARLRMGFRIHFGGFLEVEMVVEVGWKNRQQRAAVDS